MIVKLIPLVTSIFLIIPGYAYEYWTCHKNKDCTSNGGINVGYCIKFIEEAKTSPGKCYIPCFFQSQCDQFGRGEICRFEGLIWKRRSPMGVCVPKEDAYAGKNSPCYKSKHCGSERQCVKFKREPKETPGKCYSMCYNQSHCDKHGRGEVCIYEGLLWQKRLSPLGVCVPIKSANSVKNEQ